MSEKGYIRIDRAIKDWEYWDVPEATALWLHILVNANWKKGYFKGIEVNRGEFITSISHLAKDVGLTYQQTRSYLEKLEKAQNITRKTTNKYTVISVVKYDTYQALEGANQHTKQQTNNKQITNKQQTNNNNRIKGIKEIKEKGNKLYIKEREYIFTPPTLEEVQEYITTNSLSLDPNIFLDYYNSNGWLVGNAPMKDWKATIRNWARRENKPPKAKSNKVIELPDYMQEQALEIRGLKHD